MTTRDDNKPRPKKAREKFTKIGLDGIQRHIFLCGDPQDAKCCKRKVGKQSWSVLKEMIKEKGLPVGRTKADCLRVCANGPIAVVYPEAVWYHSCRPEVIREIVERHLQHGEIVEDYVLHKKDH